MNNPLQGPGAGRRFLVGLFVLFQAYLLFVRRHDTLDLDVGPNTEPTENIYQDNRIGQTFVARRNNLARIDVAMGTHARINDKAVFFRLWEEKPERLLLRETVFSAADVKNNLFHPVIFRSVRGSLGRKYYFVFSSAESTNDNSICVWMNRHDIYPDGEYYFRHQPRGGDLMFRVYSRQTVAGEMGRLTRKYGGVLGSRIIFAAAAIFFEVSLTVLFSRFIGLIWRTRPVGGRERQ